MRFGALVVLLAAVSVSASCGGGGFFRQYEYEEEIYLSVDGSATVYVNSSVAALNALRGASFDTSPAAQIDRAAVRQYFTTPITRVTRQPSLSRRSNRRFVHVRLDVDDVRRLGEATPFAWSSYQFVRNGNVLLYQQTVTQSAGKPASTNWTGNELVAFRLHVPSRITDHNAGAGNPRRGNILVWEQSLTDRMRSVPLTMTAQMEPESILYRTLFLFAATFIAVGIGFVLVIWWILRRGEKPAQV
jgi:hypothetical protein